MESPTRIPNIESHSHSDDSSGRKSKELICGSPEAEFQFWTSFPQPNLHSADELFVDGILRPLHLLDIQPNPPPNPQLEDPLSQISPASITSNSTTLTSSKRWKDIFKKSATQEDRDRDKEKPKKEKKISTSTSSTAESLSIINIWPFSRSKSAGSRGRMLSGGGSGRKVSSAPCSRSNSGGESKSRKWPASPNRSGGVHLGRSSPVWQLKSRRSSATRTSSIASAAAGGGRVLNFNVPNMCIGYGDHFSCRSDHNTAAAVPTATRRSATNVAGANNLFNLRSLFSTKKVH